MGPNCQQDPGSLQDSANNFVAIIANYVVNGYAAFRCSDAIFVQHMIIYGSLIDAAAPFDFHAEGVR